MSFFPEIVFEGDKSDEGVVRDTQRYITILEKFIIGHPTEWYWVHKRWKRTEGQLP
jgi:KDO2-lipid IV(A) lauroyltransferase